MIDFYYATSSGEITFFGGGYQQIGMPTLGTKPSSHIFTTSGGTIVSYPDKYGTDTTSISLECGVAEAAGLRRMLYENGGGILAGAHLLQAARQKNVVATTGVEFYVNGDISTELISYGLDLCRMEIPIQMVSGFTDSVPVPAITASTYAINTAGWAGGTTYSGVLSQLPMAYESHKNLTTEYYTYTIPNILPITSALGITFCPALPSAYSERTITTRLYRYNGKFWEQQTDITGTSEWEKMEKVVFAVPDGLAVGETLEYLITTMEPSALNSARTALKFTLVWGESR